VASLSIEPGAPWENGSVESFNGKLRVQFLNGELFDTLKEAQILTERWRTHDSTVRPHSRLGGQHRLPKSSNL
jgi:transposase InsO family protein